MLTITQMMTLLISIMIHESAYAARDGSSELHDGCLNNTDESVLTSGPLLKHDKMRVPCDGPVSDSHVISILQLLETLHWNQVIVFCDHAYRNTGLQLLLPVLGLSTIYDLSDLHSRVEVKQLLQDLHRKFFPRLQFLLLCSCSRALDIIQIVDRFDLDSNRTTEFRHHSYWVVACYSPHQPITRHLPHIYHLENLVLIASDKNDCTKVHRLVTASGGRSFSVSDLMEGTEDVFPNTRYGLNNSTLIVSTLTYEPFVMKNGNSIEGYLIDILDALASTLNFSYEIVHPADMSYGEIADDRWNGFIGQLERREIDLTVAALTIHEDREKVMDFLHPPVYNWMDDIMYKLHTEETGSWKIYMKPFRVRVLLILLIILLVSTGLGYIMTRWDDNTGKGGNSWKLWMPTVTDTFFYMFGILIIRGLESHRKSQSTRLLLFTWGIFSVVIAACYSAMLVASFASQRPKLPFTSLGEMVRQKEYTWGFESGTIKQHIFKRSRYGDMKMAWEGVLKFNKTDPEVLSVDEAIHIAKVKKDRYAIVTFRYIMEKLRRQDCSIHFLGQDVIWHQIGIGVPTDYPLKKELEDM